MGKVRQRQVGMQIGKHVRKLLNGSTGKKAGHVAKGHREKDREKGREGYGRREEDTEEGRKASRHRLCETSNT